MKKRKREIRQNRHNWRKVRKWKKRMIRDKKGVPARDRKGKIKFSNVIIKSKEWVKVKI